MSRDLDNDLTPLRSEADLREFFVSAGTHPDRRGVGTEHEKIGFNTTTLGAISFDGDNGIAALLRGMATRFEWKPQYDEGHIVALERDGAAITLEPGGQFELSGRITQTIHETAHELNTHLYEVHVIAEELGQLWTFFGLNPWLELDDVPWMPKSRYKIMRRYLPSRGKQSDWMMKMTATVQANFDYVDERDAMEILRIGAQLGPICTALFASSPFKQGTHGSGFSTRMEVWEHTDPDRCGTPAFMLRPDATFDDYIGYMVDMPMFFIRRDGKYIDLAGVPFRDLLEGRTDYEATWGDWELHLSTAFPTVRMKRYIEMRSADCGPTSHILAYAALWKGILYDREARAEASQLFPITTTDEALSLGRVARIDGLDGVWQGTSLRESARRLIDIATHGLDRQADGIPSEAVYLEALTDERGRPTSPAECLADVWREHAGDKRRILAELGGIGRAVRP